MRPIEKGAPPRVLAAYQARKEAVWEELTQEDKQAIRQALVQEQRGLCAYCMMRIAGEAESTKIEHIRPRRYREGLFDWSNLVACCDGREGRPSAHQTCDTKKGDAELGALNVLAPQKIRYAFGSARVGSELGEVDRDLNDALNLNDAQLVVNRKQALDVAMKLLKRKMPAHGSWPVGSVRRALEQLRSRQPLDPYFGIVEHWLDRHIH